jgi:hypothetical protein
MSASTRSAIYTALWCLALGYIVLYLYCALIGFFSPGEMAIYGVVAAILAIALLAHGIRMWRITHDRWAPGHDELMRGLRRQRETRGF